MCTHTHTLTQFPHTHTHTHPQTHAQTYLSTFPTAVISAQPPTDVAFLVYAQFAGEGEAAAALVTAVGLGLLVDGLVALEVADLREALSARL